MIGANKTFYAIIAIASTALGTLEFIRRYLTKKKKYIPWRSVGRVTELAIFPLRHEKKIQLNEIYCTQHGLRSLMYENLRDGCIIMYEGGSKKLLQEENYYFEGIEVDCNQNMFVIKSPNLQPLRISFNRISEQFTMISVHKGEIIAARDCGQRAAEWVNQLLPTKNIKVRLAYYNMDFENDPRLPVSYQKFLSNVQLLTRNGVTMHSNINHPLLINEDSIDGMTTTMGTYINPYQFSANIVIRCPKAFPLEEYTWKKIKIGNVEFDCIKRCETCVINRNSLYCNNSNHPIDMKNFMSIIKTALQKYVDFPIRDTPYIGITLKLSGKQGVIKLNDEVFVLP